MITTKKEIISTADGTTELFQTSNVYIENTLWIFAVDSGTGATTMVVPTEFDGGEYFQISPAPATGTSLYCVYDHEDGVVIPEEDPIIDPDWDPVSILFTAQVDKVIADRLLGILVAAKENDEEIVTIGSLTRKHIEVMMNNLIVVVKATEGIAGEKVSEKIFNKWAELIEANIDNLEREIAKLKAS